VSATLAEPVDTLPAQRAALERDFAPWLVKLPSGAQVALRECGKGAGPAVVLLHGISSGAASWLQVAQRLAATHHVIAWDAPGYGHSSPLPQAAPAAADYARRLDDLLDALGIARCTLVGHSLGALMACACAQLHPQRVERLVLISPARGYGSDPAQAQRVRTQRLQALQDQGVAGIAARIDARLLSAGATAQAREWVRWNAGRLHADGYRQAVEMLCTSTLALPSGVPAEIHCGDADVVTPPAACAQVAQDAAIAFHTIAAAGHASPVEQAASVAALIADAATRTGALPHA
jgi:pimeloyl-ACP methyl ester carboxylesterase